MNGNSVSKNIVRLDIVIPFLLVYGRTFLLFLQMPACRVAILFVRRHYWVLAYMVNS